MAQDVAAVALGGGTAGIVGGLVYLSAGLVAPAMGAASTLLVLISINLTLGLVAGGAVGLGISALQRTGPGAWRVLAGGAIGGLMVGAVAHMIGNDLFELLFGRSPGAITGGGEGAVLGFAVAGGFLAAQRIAPEKLWARTLAGFATGGLAGAAIALAGGKLMAGSLAELAQRFPDSRLGFDRAGTLLAHESRISLGVATTLEGALFAGFAVCALLFARRLRASKA